MRLIAAKCPACSASLAPGNDDLVVVCEECFTCIRLDEGDVAEISVRFVAPGPEPATTRWVPFWVFEGEVVVTERTTHDGPSLAAAWATWEKRRLFFVPAWRTTTRAARSTCREMLEVEPRLQPVERPVPLSLMPVTLAADDARKVLDLTVFTIEVKRADMLKSLKFDLEVGDPEVWALPESSVRTGAAPRAGVAARGV